jgi:5-methylcytosine-specific restriction endonuclease McrA
MSDEPKYRDEEWLREQYVDEQKSAVEIADEVGTYDATIYRWLDKFNIPRQSKRGRDLSENHPVRDERYLYYMYVERDIPSTEIGKEIDVSGDTVCHWMDKHGIPRHKNNHWQGRGESHHNWRGGTHDYGAGWNHDKRREVRSRDGHTCQDPKCSVTQEGHHEKYSEKLHVHHLRKARAVDDPEERNAKENLITLCRDCHQRWEQIADAGLVPQVEAVGD